MKIDDSYHTEAYDQENSIVWKLEVSNCHLIWAQEQPSIRRSGREKKKKKSVIGKSDRFTEVILWCESMARGSVLANQEDPFIASILSPFRGDIERKLGK